MSQSASERTPLDYDSSLRIITLEGAQGGNAPWVTMIADELRHSRVKVVTSVPEALLELDSGRYDALIADLSLSGAAATEVARLRIADPGVAAVVLTGSGPDGTEAGLSALAHGAQDYLAIGLVDGSRLARAVLNSIQRQRARPAPPDDPVTRQALLDALDTASCLVASDGTIAAVNTAWRAFMTDNGGDATSCAEGSNYLVACDRVARRTPDSITAAEVGQGLRDVLAGRLTRYRHEYPCHSPTVDRWFTSVVASAVIAGSPAALVSHVDLTPMHDVKKALSLQALHDGLTGLPNRQLLDDRLSQSLLDCESRQSGLMVALLEIDQLAGIHQKLGRAATDTLVVQVAERLHRGVNSGDTLSRFSDSAFIVVRPDTFSTDQALQNSAQLLLTLQEPFEVGPTPLRIRASIGLVVGRMPAPGDDLVQAAVSALAEAELHGSGRIRLFTGELPTGARHQRPPGDLSGGISEAAAVHYQPIIDMRTDGHVLAVDAVIVGGAGGVGAAQTDTISTTPSSTVVGPMTSWVLEQACGDVASLTGMGQAINLGVSLPLGYLTQSDVLRRVKDSLAQSGLHPGRLVLQIPEATVLADPASALVSLRALSELGVRISISSFGIGATTLLELRRYPISFIKLDRSFVLGIGVDPRQEAFCSSVISLADAVGARPVAEGVETPQQYAVLHGFGCGSGQGPLWSPAVPLAQLHEAIKRCSTIAMPAATRRRRSALQQQPEVSARIGALQDVGASLQTIAAALNRDGTVNLTGMQWIPSDVARLAPSKDGDHGLQSG